MPTRTVHKGFFQLDIVDTPDGKREVLRTNDSVSVLLYDEERNRVLLVRQPRAAMITPENPEGFITENVAGRFDVALSPTDLVIKEAWEEAGVRLNPDDVIIMNDGRPMAVSAGALTERSYLALAVIREGSYDPKERTFGAADEHERITRVWVPIADLERQGFEDVRVFALVQYLLRLLETDREV